MPGDDGGGGGGGGGDDDDDDGDVVVVVVVVVVASTSTSTSTCKERRQPCTTTFEIPRTKTRASGLDMAHGCLFAMPCKVAAQQLSVSREQVCPRTEELLASRAGIPRSFEHPLIS